MERSHNTHVEKMLKETSELLKKRETQDCQMQSPEYKVCMDHGSTILFKCCILFQSRGFNKDLFLHPGMDLPM